MKVIKSEMQHDCSAKPLERKRYSIAPRVSATEARPLARKRTCGHLFRPVWKGSIFRPNSKRFNPSRAPEENHMSEICFWVLGQNRWLPGKALYTPRQLESTSYIYVLHFEASFLVLVLFFISTSFTFQPNGIEARPNGLGSRHYTHEKIGNDYVYYYGNR